MKNIIRQMTILAAIVVTFSITAWSESDFVLSYDPSNKTLNIQGAIGAEEGDAVTVNIAGYTEEEPVFSPENLPLISQLYATGENGVFSVAIPVSDNVASGKYLVILYGNGWKRSDSIMLVNKNNTATKEVLALINNANSKDAVKSIIISDGDKLGIDTMLVGKYVDYAAKYSFVWKKGNFTLDSFYDAFFTGVAIDMICSDKNVNGAMQKYAKYFGTNYTKYTALEDDFKAILNSLLSQADYLTVKATEAYGNAYLLTRFKAASSWTEFRDILMEVQSEVGIDIESNAAYQKIPNSSKYQVFVDMHKQRATIETLSNVKTSFLNNAEKVYLQTTKNEPVKTSPSGGGRGITTIASTEDILVPVAAESEQKIFLDIEDHFSEFAVVKMNEMGILNGYEDGTFRPDSTVTRAEFSKMVVGAFGIDNSISGSEQVFSDVSSKDWFSKYVIALFSKNVLQGADGNFMPGANITRQDVAVIIYRMLKAAEQEITGAYVFDDLTEIDEYARQSVGMLAYNGILLGYDNKFRGKDFITRGEASVLVYRVIEKYIGTGDDMN